MIDENRSLCEQLSRMLTDEGHVVTCAQTGKEGLQAARQLNPDLLILDLVLPELSGLELFQRLARHTDTKKIPIIVISDYPELQDELTQVFDFIAKPVDQERLLEDVKLLQDGRGRRQPAGTLSLKESEEFCLFLAEHSGLHFDRRNLKLLERGILNRMQVLKIDSYQRYFTYLNRFRESRGELQKLLQCLTVGETYFYRYHSQFDALRTMVLPLLAKRGQDHPLRIWSAGCSTGEEAYSLAMTAMEVIPDWRDRDIRIIATDINNRSLRLAKEGIYGPRALRATERRHLNRFFEKSGDKYRVIDEVRDLVTFFHLNLQTGNYPDPEGLLHDLDIIFCRNVLIYFAAGTARTIVQKFHATLAEGGFLFLGHAETLFHVTNRFERLSHGGAFFYKSRDQQIVPAQPPARRLERAAPRTAPPPAKEVMRSNVVPLMPRQQQREAADLLGEAQQLFEAEDFVAASRKLAELLRQEPLHPDAMVLQGFILANEGRFAEALAACDQVLAINDLLPEAYHLRGLVNELEGKTEAAAANYQKAILLRMEFLMPHYHLGKLFLRTGRTKDGVRELRNTLKILERSKPELVIPYSGGLSREVFLGLVRSDLAMVS